MGLLSKLFGGDGKEVEKTAKDILGELFGADNAQPAPAGPESTAREPEYDDGVPAEENQYNSGKPYDRYFEDIFRAELPGYTFEKSTSGGRNVAYTFTSGGARVLVVELMTDRSSANKLRRDCERASVPYLRFYYDHRGWWNTRSYVVNRLHTVI